MNTRFVIASLLLWSPASSQAQVNFSAKGNVSVVYAMAGKPAVRRDYPFTVQRDDRRVLISLDKRNNSKRDLSHDVLISEGVSYNWQTFNPDAFASGVINAVDNKTREVKPLVGANAPMNQANLVIWPVPFPDQTSLVHTAVWLTMGGDCLYKGSERLVARMPPVVVAEDAFTRYKLGVRPPEAKLSWRSHSGGVFLEEFIVHRSGEIVFSVENRQQTKPIGSLVRSLPNFIEFRSNFTSNGSHPTRSELVQVCLARPVDVSNQSKASDIRLEKTSIQITVDQYEAGRGVVPDAPPIPNITTILDYRTAPEVPEYSYVTTNGMVKSVQAMKASRQYVGLKGAQEVRVRRESYRGSVMALVGLTLIAPLGVFAWLKIRRNT